MSNPLVSAVIITHNRKDMVVGAISSVQNQTYKNIEIIVVDDASVDGSRELLAEKANNENGIRPPGSPAYYADTTDGDIRK